MGKSEAKNQWKKESGYIWAMLGSAVGFANILSFSAQCYRNGGGAFLIPYIFATLVMGVPMLFLEGIIGQRFGLPIVSAYGKVAGSTGKFFGWLSVMAVITIGAFYTVLTGYSVAYTYFSATGTIPADTAHFFKNVFIQDSGSIFDFGRLSQSVLWSTLLVVVFSWYIMTKNIQSGIEKTCAFFLPLLSILVIGFALLVTCLPGATIGFKEYLRPDFSKLSNWGLWRDVFGHLFFSFSLGLGIITGYSRHTKASMSVRRAMIWVAIGDFSISFISGLAIFGCVGYLSNQTGTPFNEIVKSDSAFEMGFVIFPSILQLFGKAAAYFIGPVFFFCVFIAGVTGVFSIIESAAGNIELEFGRTRKQAVTITMGITTLLLLFFCMGNGQHILGALQPMVLGYNMLLGGIAEIVVFLFLSKTIQSDPIWNNGNKKSLAYKNLKTIVPIILGFIFCLAFYQEFLTPLTSAEVVRWGWFLLACLLSFILSRRKTTLPEMQASKD